MYICSIMANKYHIIFKFIDRINEDGPQTLEWSKSSGPRLTKDKWPKGGLWLLLLKHEWQWKDGDREDETGKDMGLKILWKTFMEGCPTRSCQLFIEVLIPSNAHIIWRENYQAVLRSSTTKKKKGKNSIDALLDLQNLEMEIKFFWIASVVTLMFLSDLI